MVAVGIVILATATAQSAPPNLISFQGQLTDAGGAPFTGSQQVRFTLLWGGTASENPSSGSPVYQEDSFVTTDVNGVFHHLIGSGTSSFGCDEDRDGTAAEPCVLTPDDFANTGGAVWLELRIDPPGDDNVLLPRQQITSVGYALNASTLEGQAASAFEESAEIDADIGAHAAVSDGHHARYADSEAMAAVLAGDGSGSGLDADMLDGQSAASFIDGVTASDGLTGGGSGGNVSVSVAPGGITATHLATNSVGSAEIATGVVGASEIALSPILSVERGTNSSNESTLTLGSYDFCALAMVKLNTVTGSGTNTYCRVYKSGSTWYLGARGNNTTYVGCQAICF